MDLSWKHRKINSKKNWTVIVELQKFRLRPFGFALKTVKISEYLFLSSTRFWIHSIFKSFHSGDQIQKVADLSAWFIRYMWLEAKSAEKKLRIQKYLQTCGWGLSFYFHVESLHTPLFFSTVSWKQKAVQALVLFK